MEVLKNLNDSSYSFYKKYFEPNLIKLLSQVSSVKEIKYLNQNEEIEKIEQINKNLKDIGNLTVRKIFYKQDENDLFQLKESLLRFRIEKPSFLVNIILELNLFPNNNDLLFGLLDMKKLIPGLLLEMKISFLDEKSNLISQFVTVWKDMLRHNLKNPERKLRESQFIFENLFYILVEGNKIESQVQGKNKKEVFTNFMLGMIFREMINYIWLNLELKLYSGYELDYIFWVLENLYNHLSFHSSQVSVKFGEKILRENDFIKSINKKKLSFTQKMFIDELNIFNGLKQAVKGLAFIASYLKKSNLIKNYQTEE